MIPSKFVDYYRMSLDPFYGLKRIWLHLVNLNVQCVGTCLWKKFLRTVQSHQIFHTLYITFSFNQRNFSVLWTLVLIYSSILGDLNIFNSCGQSYVGKYVNKLTSFNHLGIRVYWTQRKCYTFTVQPMLYFIS